eukprot:COSAG01_NODE_303_length_19167_cov_10.792454_29_plen_47_part_01
MTSTVFLYTCTGLYFLRIYRYTVNIRTPGGPRCSDIHSIPRISGNGR